MPSPQYYIPANIALSGNWPSDIFELIGDAPEISELLAQIGVSDLNYNSLTYIYAILVFQKELSLEIPGISGLELVFGNNEEGLTKLPFELNLVDPFLFSINRFPIQLRFSRNILQPVIEEDGHYVADPDEEKKVAIRISPSVIFSGDGQVQVRDLETIEISSIFMIGNSGFSIELSTLSLVLEERSLVQRGIESVATPDLPDDFRGVFIPTARLYYYKNGTSFNPTFELLNAGIGTGGFTGIVSLGVLSRAEEDIEEQYLILPEEGERLPLPNHLLGLNTGSTQMNGLEVIFQYIGVNFTQSIPTAALITGYMYLVFVGRWMKFKAGMGGPEGDLLLEVGGIGDAGLVDLNNDWFQIIVDSIRYELRKNEQDQNINYAIINGSIKPKIPGFEWPKFNVERLSISSQGDIDIDGGWIDIPETFTLDFHGFKLDIEQIGLGDEETTGRQWFGFSGGITLVEGIPLSASVQGLRVSWDPDNAPTSSQPLRRVKVSLEGIAVHLEIPNTLILDGSVSYHELERPPETTETDPEEPPATLSQSTGVFGHTFTGSVTVDLVALKTQVSAELLIGDLTQYSYDARGNLIIGKKFKAFYIVLDVQLPTALPLGATGTGLYGLTGLFGMHVAPDRKLEETEPESWYLWYKNRKGNIEGTEYNITKVVKWAPRFDNLAFGAGVTLGTVYDDGFTITGYGMVLISNSEAVVFEMKADLLKQRSGGKDAEGALYALIVFDRLADTFQMNVDINFTLQDIITVGGGLEAFFDFNDNSKWYIYIGQKEPESKRIRAEVISLVTASAYFMIDPRAIQFGAAAGLDLDYKYGPLVIRIILRIIFEIGLFLKEPQLTGLIELYGELTVKIFGFGISLILQTLLEGSTPQPWWIHGLMRVVIKLPWPLPNFKVKVELTWGETGQPARVDLLKGAYMIHPKQIGKSWELATEEENALVVPVDAIPILSCGKPISRVSTIPSEAGGPEWVPLESVEGWEFGYDIKAFTLTETRTGEVVSGSSYQASFSDTVGPTNPQQPWLSGGGIYQLPVEQNQEGETTNNIQEPQVLLWQYSPLSVLHPNYRERYLNSCRRTTRRSPQVQCVHWRNVAAGTSFPLVFKYKNLSFLTHLGEDAPIVTGSRTLERGLLTNGLTIHFSEPVDWVRINFRINSASCASYYRGRLVSNSQTSPSTEYQVSAVVDVIRIFGPGNPSVVTQICYIIKRDRDSFWQGTEASSDSNPTAMVDGLFLKSNTSYKLTVNSQRRERREGNTDFTAQEQTIDYYFKTAKAPGLNINSEEDNRDREVDFRDSLLNRLETYIERTVPQNGAKLFYRGYRVLVEFNEPYFNSTYISNLYPENLSLRVKDRNGATLLGSNTTVGIEWINSELPLLTPGLLAMLSAPSQAACSGQRPDWQQFSNQYLSCVLPDTVNPNRMYIIEIVSGQRLLYQFQFATSRYFDLVEHLESGLISDDTDSARRNQLIRLGLPNSAQRLDVSWFDRYFELLEQVAEERKQLWFAVNWSSSATVPSKTISEAQASIQEARDALHAFSTETYNWLDRGGEHPNPDFANLTYSGIHQLFEAVGLGHRPLPPKVELVQIGIEGTDSYFLLLESPEPLEWQRLILISRIEDRSSPVFLPVIWNEDQTRAFIFSDRTDGMFAAGNYTLTFECDRGGVDSDREGVDSESFRTIDLDTLLKSDEFGGSIGWDRVIWDVQIGL